MLKGGHKGRIVVVVPALALLHCAAEGRSPGDAPDASAAGSGGERGGSGGVTTGGAAGASAGMGGTNANGGVTAAGGASGGATVSGAGAGGAVEGGVLDSGSRQARYPECTAWCTHGSAVCPATDLEGCFARCDDGAEQVPSCAAEYLALTACQAGQPDADFICTGDRFRLLFGVCSAEYEADVACVDGRP